MVKRSLLLKTLIVFIGVSYTSKLFNLQVLQLDKSKKSLNSSTVKKVFTYPERGFIFDRNNELLVGNQPSYNLMVTPNQIQIKDTIEFCNLTKTDLSYFKKKIKKARNWSPRLPSVYLANLDKKDFASLQEKMYKFKGFHIEKKMLRTYPIPIASNVLGYINEVNEETALKNDYYQAGEIIGTTGVEKQYENILRGKKGVAYLKRNRFNKVTGSYKNGIYDSISIPGDDLTLTLDSRLQLLGETLMKGKRGGIVAIEPQSGEILALVTAPSYDPNLMVGRLRSTYSVKFFNDTINLPMYDRSLLAQYAPGSTFKMIQGLIGLEEGIINENTSVKCYGGYRYGAGKEAFMGCHCGTYGRKIKLQKSIANSCNSFFAHTYKNIIEKHKTTSEGMDIWSNHVKSFGLGNFLGYDLPKGRKGLIPNSTFYNKWYPNNAWRASYTISNAIGQGQILVTPIQLANMTAAIANKGHFFKPHILKKVNNKSIENIKYTKVQKTSISPKHFDKIINGMEEVFLSGTAKHVKIKQIDMCGKTGTVENFKRIKGEKVQFDDHSIFIAFAPKENPQIAISVFVENGGYGSTIAAPIASLIIEKHLTGKTNSRLQKHIENKSLQEVYDKQLLMMYPDYATTKNNGTSTKN